MRLVLWANGARGVACLEALAADSRRPSLVVVHPRANDEQPGAVELAAGGLGIPAFAPEDPNAPEAVERLRRESADVFALAGYGRILRGALLDLPAAMTVNLHAGALPEYRGSSPMNWALINGERSFALSIIEVDRGVDTGDVLAERRFPIGIDSTIRDLHAIANRAFPRMLLDVLRAIESGSVHRRAQDPRRARYFPLRFPDDGLVLWDQLSAEQIHNRVRALRPPYPGAFTYYDNRRVTLIASEPATADVRGEPGRAYRKTARGLLVCAADRCLWIREARFDDDGAPLRDAIGRYDELATMRQVALRHFAEAALPC